MTKKKQRNKLARALRKQGIRGARGFKVAKVIVNAGHPLDVEWHILHDLDIGQQQAGSPFSPQPERYAAVYDYLGEGDVLVAWSAFRAELQA